MKQSTETKLVYTMLTIAISGFLAFLWFIAQSQTCVDGICSGGIL